jgi:hypothetical protein
VKLCDLCTDCTPLLLSSSAFPPSHPSQNAFFRRWDIIVVLAVLFTATVTPFEVAFLKTSLNGLFFVNRIIDILFLLVRMHKLAVSYPSWLAGDRWAG